MTFEGTQSWLGAAGRWFGAFSAAQPQGADADQTILLAFTGVAACIVFHGVWRTPEFDKKNSSGKPEHAETANPSAGG